MPKAKKKSVRYSLNEETTEMIQNNYRKAHCRYPAHYVEKAVDFYTGYINSDRDSYYLPKALLSNLKAIVDVAMSQQNRMLFKQAVEIAMIENILTVIGDLDHGDVDRLRGDCVEIVKRTNGNFKFENAINWQRR